MTITKNTATDIAFAYRELETAEKLLDLINRSLSSREQPDIRDAFGRMQGGLQLGVPNGSSGHSLYNVPWSLARPVIEAHIAHQKSIIAVLSEKARIEIETEEPAPIYKEKAGKQ